MSTRSDRWILHTKDGGVIEVWSGPEHATTLGCRPPDPHDDDGYLVLASPSEATQVAMALLRSGIGDALWLWRFDLMRYLRPRLRTSTLTALCLGIILGVVSTLAVTVRCFPTSLNSVRVDAWNPGPLTGAPKSP